MRRVLFDRFWVAIMFSFPIRGLSPAGIQIHPRRGGETLPKCLIQWSWGRGGGERFSQLNYSG